MIVRHIPKNQSNQHLPSVLQLQQPRLVGTQTELTTEDATGMGMSGPTNTKNQRFGGRFHFERWFGRRLEH